MCGGLQVPCVRQGDKVTSWRRSRRSEVHAGTEMTQGDRGRSSHAAKPARSAVSPDFVALLQGPTFPSI